MEPAEQKNGLRTRWKRFVAPFFLLYLFLLSYFTLFTHNYYIYGQSVNLDLFDSILFIWRSGNFWLILKNVFGNILLFIPFGFFLPFFFPFLRRGAILLLLGALVSFLIEVLQYSYARRIFDIDDILLNSLGTLCGFLFFRTCRAFFQIAKKKFIY